MSRPVPNPPLPESPELRQTWAEELLTRLTPVMSALGILFLLVVLGERLARPGSLVAASLTVVGWALWAAFAGEFLLRLRVAPDVGRFLRRNWWQLGFLVLPFLRFLHLFRALRMLRAGRVLSSAVRSSRSARTLLGGRIGWLTVLSAIVVLASSQLLHEFGGATTYGEALHATALAAITGEPLDQPGAVPTILEIGLAMFSVAVFATVAASVGAYFLEASRDGADERGDPPPGP